jgi:hypothetical protein
VRRGRVAPHRHRLNSVTVYTIEARAFRVALAGSHNFWVLKDDDRGVILGELHGLAYDRVKRVILPIGTNRNHALRMFVFPHDAAYAATLGLPVSTTRMFRQSRARVAYRGADGLDRWNAAIAALPLLDALDVDYPPYGFNVLRPTLNSNAAYRTFGEIMGVPVHRFAGALAPGGRQRICSASEIERLKYRGIASTPAQERVASH